MTKEALVAAISLICKIKDPDVTQSKKMDCIEYMVNCSIQKVEEEFDAKIVKECEKKWKKN